MNAFPTSLALTWNPAIGLAEAVALGVLFIVVGTWLAWRGSAEASRKTRRLLVALRVLGLLLVAVIWLNPGRWIEFNETTRRDWIVLLDRSASMQAEHGANLTRWKAGNELATELRKASGAKGDVLIRTFSKQLEDETITPETLTPDGDGTDLGRGIGGALDQRATPLAGLIVVSDGRSTASAKLGEIALRARGRGLPIHTIALGTSWGSRDLLLTAMPRQVTGFKGQPVKVSAQVENRGLGPVKPAVILIGPDGKEVARKDVAIADGARQTVTFDLAEVPEGGGDYILRTAAWEGEHIPANNSDTVRVNILISKTRVLLLEGSPYWDSKFLAQLLRQQSAVDILTVHRLNEERYFRVELKGAEPLQSPDTVFPASAEELSRYDLIVFGKGADGFLTPERITALQGFVRDQGGAVLFARGKPYGGRFPAIESMEPMEWAESYGEGYRFTPLADTNTDLFGAALPAADDRVWSTLPTLEGVHGVVRLKPFARVLAEGATEGKQTRIPMLVVRRYGRGMVAGVNADGLWRWDFRPEIREQGGLYQQFWAQLMQWCATYSEFRPGQDYAVRLNQAATELGQPVRAVISYRGASTPEPKPALKIFQNGKPVADSAATPLPGGEGGREWAAVVNPESAGRFEVRVVDQSRPGKEEGSAILSVLAPPKESDDLRPDTESLATLARESGGKTFAPEQAAELMEALWKKDESAARNKPQWESAWTKGWIALLIALIFGSEWWVRRREGLL